MEARTGEKDLMPEEKRILKTLGATSERLVRIRIGKPH